MKKTIFLLFFSLLFLHLSSQVISVSECLFNGKRPIDFSKSNIVDINSDLVICLNRDSLTLKYSRSFQTHTKLVEQLDQLNSILAFQHEILSILQKDMQQSSADEKLKLLGDYSQYMVNFYNLLFKYNELRAKANDFFKEYRSSELTIDKNKYPNPETYVIKKFSLEANALLDQINALVEEDRMDIRLVAFLDTKDKLNQKVHIENFDNYSQGEYYDLPRWGNSFSEEDINAFNKTKDWANNMNQLLTSGTKSMNNLLSKNLPSYRCFNYILGQSQSLLNEKDWLLGENKKVVTDFIDQIRFIADKQLILFSEFTSATEQESNINVLEMFNEKRQQLLSQLAKIPRQIDSLIHLLPDQVLKSNSKLICFTDSLSHLKTYIGNDLGKIKNVIQLTSELLIPISKTSGKTEDVGEEVFNLSINQLPKEGYISLKNTGKRDNGDELRLCLRIQTQEDKAEQRPGTIIERINLALYKVKFYSESKVSLILANPYNKNDKVTLTNNLQFAPSGSLLFKYGSRRFRAWNYISPGIGFNMSTPDFDLDGTPDVAIGGVVSLLKDVVMAGWSYNTKTDSPFWFFGLSLPFSVPGIPINQMQNNQSPSN